MRNVIQKSIIVLFVAVFSSLSFALNQKPAWVKKRPISRFHYLGIAMAPKSGINRDYTEKAKNSALNDLASEITVNISGETITLLIEQYGMLEQEVKSEIRSSTEANLEGYELVDTWEDNTEYWVYYRLSKDLYHQQKLLKIQRAVSLALDMFEKGKVHEKEKNISEALAFYLQSLTPIQSYIDEPLETEFQGTRIYLLNEIYSSIHSLLNRIEFRPNPEKQDAKIGQPLKSHLEATATYTSALQETTPVSKLPVKFGFIRGSGDLVDKLQSNPSGKAACRVSKITATDKIQMVNAELDLFGLISRDSFPKIFTGFLNNLPVPGTKFILNVSGLTVCIEASEKNLGRRLDVPIMEPAVKNVLTEYGFTFTDEMSHADIFIELKAEARRGSEMYGMYSSFVNFTISVVNMDNGNEVYKNAMQDIKGIQLSYDKAGLKAFENAVTEVSNNILSDLVKQIQR